MISLTKILRYVKLPKFRWPFGNGYVFNLLSFGWKSSVESGKAELGQILLNTDGKRGIHLSDGVIREISLLPRNLFEDIREGEKYVLIKTWILTNKLGRSCCILLTVITWKRGQGILIFTFAHQIFFNGYNIIFKNWGSFPTRCLFELPWERSDKSSEFLSNSNSQPSAADLTTWDSSLLPWILE